MTYLCITGKPARRVRVAHLPKTVYQLVAGFKELQNFDLNFSASCRIPDLQAHINVVNGEFPPNGKVPHGQYISFECDLGYSMEGDGEGLRCYSGRWYYGDDIESLRCIPSKYRYNNLYYQEVPSFFVSENCLE